MAQRHAMPILERLEELEGQMGETSRDIQGSREGRKALQLQPLQLERLAQSPLVRS